MKDLSSKKLSQFKATIDEAAIMAESKLGEGTKLTVLLALKQNNGEN